MKKEGPFSFLEWFKSFRYAAVGMWDMLRTEHNAWVHAIVTVFVLGFSVWLRISGLEFSMIVMAVVGVWAAEAFNTVLEIVMNMISPEYSRAAQRAKDIAAGGVLIASIGSAIIGLFILGPPLWAKLQILF
ncbi:MAG: diacylglycerol kinase family protein [Candidatus Omnitrophica bacterium]|nr:diacylglycerol kinase family protein [Candidatus Omnitrophota bacterium]